MNYDEARQIESGGWHWTTMNDRKVRTAWPCLRYVGPEKPLERMMNATPDDFERCAPHATREEAERHWYDACLEAVEESNFGDWSGCRVCDAPTKKGLGNPQMSRAFHVDPLCDEHRTKETLSSLHPFKSGWQVIHS